MTKTLTEQWQNGEIDDGLYYFKLPSGETTITSKWGILGSAWKDTKDEIEVLAPVPSYDKVKEMSQKIERLEFDNEALEISRDELGKKLEIAIKALKEYDNKQNWDIRGVSFMKYNKGFTIARKALKEMEGVK